MKIGSFKTHILDEINSRTSTTQSIVPEGQNKYFRLEYSFNHKEYVQVVVKVNSSCSAEGYKVESPRAVPSEVSVAEGAQAASQKK